MAKSSLRKKTYELTLLIIGCILLAAAFAFASKNDAFEVAAAVETTISTNEANEQDHSRFRHANPNHSRMPCLLCHKREDNSAAPKFSGHLPCAGCHTEQFKDRESKICTICHTNAQSGALKRFPGLKSFNSRFDHGRHVRQTGCATCHKPSRRGVALSVPSGLGAHNTCYQCHGPRTEIGGKNIGSCSTCHQPGRPTRNSDRSPAFAKNFDHSEHRSAAGLNCASCHTVRAGMPRGRQVSAPAASMHFARSGVQSCASCHNNKRAFGGTDFGDCKRCHQGATFKF